MAASPGDFDAFLTNSRRHESASRCATAFKAFSTVLSTDSVDGLRLDRPEAGVLARRCADANGHREPDLGLGCVPRRP